MRILYFIISFSFIIYNLQAQVVSIDNSKEITSIGNCISYFEDESSNLTIDKIVLPEFTNKFWKHNKKIFFHPPTTSSFWFKFIVSNHSGVDLWLSLGIMPPEYIDLYAANSAGDYILKVSTGGLRPTKNIPYSDTFWLPLNASQQKDSMVYYLRTKSGPPIELAFQLGSIGALCQCQKKYDNLAWSFISIMTLIILIVLVLWFGIRKKIFLFYFFALSTTIIITPLVNGFFLIPKGNEKYAWWADYSLLLLAVAMIAYGYFVVIYMNLKQNFIFGYYAISSSLIILAALALGSFFIPYSLIMSIFEISLFFSETLCLIAIYHAWLVKKMPLAIFYAFGQTFLFVSIVIVLLSINNYIPYNFFTRNILYFGVVIDTLFFLVAIYDRLMNMRKKKHLAEVALLEKTLETQNVLKEYARNLEIQVEERTNDLRIVNKNLYTTYREIEEKNKELLEQSVVLSKMNATKNKIFSIITHDLRNPFFVISNLADMGITNCRKVNQSQLEEFFQAILKSSKSASALLENLSEWAHFQSGYRPVNPTIISIRQKVEQEIISVHQIAVDKRVNITIYNTDDCAVWADRNMLTTVIRNLLTNALKYSFEGGNIVVSWQVIMNLCEVSVKDDGIGISAIHKNNLFRVDKSNSTLGTANEKGTGLGLIMCKELVELNGGLIWVESEEGSGSNFKFTLPIRSTYS